MIEATVQILGRLSPPVYLTVLLLLIAAMVSLRFLRNPGFASKFVEYVANVDVDEPEAFREQRIGPESGLGSKKNPVREPEEQRAAGIGA